MNENWRVYTGESFNIWEPDTGKYFGSVDAGRLKSHLHEKRLRQSRTSSSAFSGLASAVVCDPATLQCLRPKIAFRNETRAKDTRTMIATLVPGNRVLVNIGPYLLQLAGDAGDEAFVLGVLSSIPLDWQARQMVELRMTLGQLNHLSIPDPSPRDPVRARVVEIAAWLASCDHRLANWARQACSDITATPARKIGNWNCWRNWMPASPSFTGSRNAN